MYFEVVDPQPLLVPSPPEMGRRDAGKGSLGRDPGALTTRRGRSRSTARLPSSQRVRTDREIMDSRQSQHTRDSSRGGHAARADEEVHDRRQRRRAERTSEENRLWSISKTLTSMLIRHGNHGASEILTTSGWASLNRLCGLRRLRNLGCEAEDIRRAVADQDARKRRFELSTNDNGVSFIRAVQGHSEGSGVAVGEVNPEVALDALPPYLFHCTFRRHMDSILTHGLLAGGDRGKAHRLQVHYVDGFPGVDDVGRGIRPGGEIGVIIDPREYAAAGGRFYATPQEAGGGAFRCYLSGSVPPRFITLIRAIGTREILYSRDERAPEAKAKAKAETKAAASAPKAAPPRAKSQRLDSPEPSAAQLLIPYFLESYKVMKAYQYKEKWNTGICRKVELAMEVNKGDERKYYLRMCTHYEVEPIPDEATYYRKNAARLEEPKAEGSSSAAPVAKAETELAAETVEVSAPSKAREEKKSEESQGSSLGPPGPPPGPPPGKSSKQRSARAGSAPARKTTGAEFLAEGREKRALSVDEKSVKSGSADTPGIASTSNSSTADAAGIASAPGASAPVVDNLEDTVSRVRERLTEASTSGQLEAVLEAMPKKKDDPKSRARKARVKKEKKKEKEDKKDSEDPGSGVDWGDESAKEEEPSSEYELVTEEEESVSSAPDAGPAASSGAVDPFRHLSGTRRSLKVREEIKSTLEHSGWHCNGCGASNLALRDRCYKCSFGISQVQLNDLKEEREELLAGGVGVPDRTSIKRGGTKRKRGGARSRAAGNSAGAAASSSAAGPSDGKGGSRGSPVDTTDRAVPESRGDEGWSGREWWDYSRGRWSSWGWQEDHREWEDHCGDRQGRDDYYEDNHYGGSREDRRDWDDYYGSRREDGYYEDRRQDYHEDRHWDREDDRTGWQDWNDRDDQEDEQYGRAYWRSRRKLPRQSALAYKSGSSSKKQLLADEELLALVPVSDRSSFESEFGSVEERSALVRLVGVRGFTLRGFVWGALCFAAAVLSSTRDVVLLGLRCLWCLSAAVRNRLAHSLNGNQDGLYPWILCGIIL